MNTFLKLLFFAALIAAIAWAVWVLQESEAQQVVVGSPRAGAGNNSLLDDPEISARMDEVFDRVSEEKLSASENGKKFKTWAKWISVVGVFSSVAISGIAAFFGVWKPTSENEGSSKKSTSKPSIAVAVMALLTAACPPISDVAGKESAELFEKTESLQTAISETRSSLYTGDLLKPEILDLLDNLELKADR